MRDFRLWRFIIKSRHAWRLSRLIKPQTNGTTGPLRECLHDTGTSFILVRVHPGSYLSLCICLHDTGEKSHTSTTHTGMSSSRWLYRIEILITVWKVIPVSCKRYIDSHSGTSQPTSWTHFCSLWSFFSNPLPNNDFESCFATINSFFLVSPRSGVCRESFVSWEFSEIKASILVQLHTPYYAAWQRFDWVKHLRWYSPMWLPKQQKKTYLIAVLHWTPLLFWFMRHPCVNIRVVHVMHLSIETPTPPTPGKYGALTLE